MTELPEKLYRGTTLGGFVRDLPIMGRYKFTPSLMNAAGYAKQYSSQYGDTPLLILLTNPEEFEAVPDELFTEWTLSRLCFPNRSVRTYSMIDYEKSLEDTKEANLVGLKPWATSSTPPSHVEITINNLFSQFL